MECPYCGSRIAGMAKNQRFCMTCGNPLYYCSKCGGVLKKGARFCMNDGTPIPQNIQQALMKIDFPGRSQTEQSGPAPADEDWSKTIQSDPTDEDWGKTIVHPAAASNTADIYETVQSGPAPDDEDWNRTMLQSDPAPDDEDWNRTILQSDPAPNDEDWSKTTLQSDSDEYVQDSPQEESEKKKKPVKKALVAALALLMIGGAGVGALFLTGGRVIKVGQAGNAADYVATEVVEVILDSENEPDTEAASGTELSSDNTKASETVDTAAGDGTSETGDTTAGGGTAETADTATDGAPETADTAADGETAGTVATAVPKTVEQTQVASDFCICTKDYYRNHLITKEDMDALNEKYKDVYFPYYTALPQMMIDELYAMEGYSFKSPGYQNYFEARDWYQAGSLAFYGYENQNIEFLVYMNNVSPFYGVFVGSAYSSQSDALNSSYVSALQQEELIPVSGAVDAINASDWKGLSVVGSGYYVLAGRYRTDVEANTVLESIKDRFPDARIMYSGEYQGSETSPY